MICLEEYERDMAANPPVATPRVDSDAATEIRAIDAEIAAANTSNNPAIAASV